MFTVEFVQIAFVTVHLGVIAWAVIHYTINITNKDLYK